VRIRWLVREHEAVGVLLTGVYGSGMSSGAEEIACLLEQRGEPCACSTWTIWGWAGANSEALAQIT
jgi:hypothetical protein